MKRKLCAPPFNCDDMEELNVTSLSRRKESAAPLTGERDSSNFRHPLNYPLALVLRLRVLQIVCGISAMVMGSVAFIEERHKFNMGLGIPAGGISVLAAAVSIHTSRGWSAVTSGAGAGAGAAAVLWAAAGCLLIALVVQCCRTILDPPGLEHGVLMGLPRFCSASGMFAEARVDCFYCTMRKRGASLVRRVRASSNSILSVFANSDHPSEEDASPRDLVVIAVVQIALAVATLLSAAVCVRIDCTS